MEKIEKLKKKLSNTLLLLKNVYQCIKTNFLPARNCDKTKNKCFTLKILVLVHVTKVGWMALMQLHPILTRILFYCAFFTYIIGQQFFNCRMISHLIPSSIHDRSIHCCCIRCIHDTYSRHQQRHQL